MGPSSSRDWPEGATTQQPAPPSQPGLEAEAAEMIAEVLQELATLAESLPVAAKDAERTAKVLDRLSEDLAESATLMACTALRRVQAQQLKIGGQASERDRDHGAARPVTSRAPGHALAVV